MLGRTEQREAVVLLESEAMGEGMFKTVLWATDGSRAAERALPAAQSIAQTYHARLIVTHVPAVLAGRGPYDPFGAEGVAQEHADAIQANLQQKVDDLKRDGVTAELALPEMTRYGDAHAIAEFAHEVGADLIVVGTRGGSRLVRALVGSVTRRLLELAPCPVLSVPPEDEDIES